MKFLDIILFPRLLEWIHLAIIIVDKTDHAPCTQVASVWLHVCCRWGLRVVAIQHQCTRDVVPIISRLGDSRMQFRVLTFFDLFGIRKHWYWVAGNRCCIWTVYLCWKGRHFTMVAAGGYPWLFLSVLYPRFDLNPDYRRNRSSMLSCCMTWNFA